MKSCCANQIPLLWRAHLKVLDWQLYIVHDISIWKVKINKDEISCIVHTIPKACNALPSAYYWCFMSDLEKKIGNCSILLPMLLYPPPSLCILALVGRVWEKIQATTGLIFFLVLVLAYMRVTLFFWIS